MKKAMRLRDKMTRWETALTFVLAAAFCAALYFITASVLEGIVEREVRLSMKQVVAQIENENGMLTFENEVPVSSTSMFFVTEENGSELASYGEDITVFDQVPVAENALRKVKGETGEWLLLDSEPVKVDHFTLRVRVAASYALSHQVLSLLRTLFWVGVPLMTLIALAGGFAIAKGSLWPIRKIIHSAEIISQGDLSERIPVAQAKDELGELTDTLNRMLANVEAAFARERRFTSDASHELRTPVAVVRAYAEGLAAEPGLTEDQRESLGTVLLECGRMQKIISQLLTMTRGQEKRYRIHMETIPLDAIGESIAETMAEQLGERNMRFAQEIPQGFAVQADQSLITQMLLNLVENAVKYGKPGGEVVLAAARRDGQAVITVRDDGRGIPKEALPHIFERFYRVDPSRDRSGTGLGLSIVRWIVQEHGGRIEVQSEVGVGTSFSVWLPGAVASSPQA
ncbi:MAG: HAMP domain-containing sensor histidine kinase [Candidatus Limiplasma sp.]|nr:HAMP domain-containing sensor histidine kinase [Candidatus Limiplasma sp.]